MRTDFGDMFAFEVCKCLRRVVRRDRVDFWFVLAVVTSGVECVVLRTSIVDLFSRTCLELGMEIDVSGLRGC